MKAFYFDSPLILEDDNWLLGLTCLEVYNSLFNITAKNSFSFFSNCCWTDLVTMNRIECLLPPRRSKDLKLRVVEVRKRVTGMEIG